MMLRSNSLSTLVLGLSFIAMAIRSSAAVPDPYPSSTFLSLIQALAPDAPDPCDAPGQEKSDATKAEFDLFQEAAKILVQELNAAPGGPAYEVASGALKKLERLSAEVNAAWPDQNRFHFEVLDLKPALVVKLTIRTHASYFVFGVPAENAGKRNDLWQQVGEDDLYFEHESSQSWLELYPLKQSPSGNVRFLARFVYSGCAGSFGTQYDAREWNPQSQSGTAQILKQEGSFGMDEAADGRKPTLKEPFVPVGILQTKGSIITLPYCWFSAIDTWDNPSLCALDTYDISGNGVVFRSRIYNRPDLVPIAKALEFAEKHDYPALRAYCASDEIARKIIRELANGYGFDTEVEVKRLGTARERVRPAYSDEPGFVVEKHGERWLVVSYAAN
jgi:hypothetical protein